MLKALIIKSITVEYFAFQANSVFKLKTEFGYDQFGFEKYSLYFRRFTEKYSYIYVPE